MTLAEQLIDQVIEYGLQPNYNGINGIWSSKKFKKKKSEKKKKETRVVNLPQSNGIQGTYP